MACKLRIKHVKSISYFTFSRLYPITKKPLQASICSCMAIEFFNNSMIKASKVELEEEKKKRLWFKKKKYVIKKKIDEVYHLS